MRRCSPNNVLVTNAQGPLQPTSGEITPGSLYCNQVLAWVKKLTAEQHTLSLRVTLGLQQVCQPQRCSLLTCN
jgi:hypothetical protein